MSRVEIVQEKTIEEKLFENKTITSIIQLVYVKELLQEIFNTKKLVEELNPEEWLKCSELLRDNIEKFEPHIVLQFIKTLLKYKEYTDFGMFNLYYYLYLFRGHTYVVNNEMIEELNKIRDEVKDKNMLLAIIQLIEDNMMLDV